MRCAGAPWEVAPARAARETPFPARAARLGEAQGALRGNGSGVPRHDDSDRQHTPALDGAGGGLGMSTEVRCRSERA